MGEVREPANVSLTQNPLICAVHILRGRIIQLPLPKTG